MLKVAIISVNFNGAKDTLEFLQSLKRLDVNGLEIKTIIVDNGSTDNSFDKLSKFKNIDLLQTGQNLGFSGGFNRGLNYAKAWGADYFFIINNDALIYSRNLLHKLIDTTKSDKKIGLVSPKILFAPGFEFHKDKYSKEQIGKIIWYGGGSFDWNNIMGKHRGIDEVDLGQYDEVCEVDYLSGCCLLITREFLETVGNFNEEFFSYMEDSDLMVRSKIAGFKKYYDGRVFIYHKVSQTAGIGSEYTDYFLTRNRLIFGLQYAKLRTKFALLREALKFLISGRKMQKKAILDYLKGSRDGLKKFSRPLENPKYSKKLSVVTVNYNTADLVKNLLDSICKKESGIEKVSTEVVVVDNGKLDPVSSFIKNYPVKYIPLPENLGFPKGFNQGINFALGEYILLLNSDIEVGENTLAKIAETAEKFDGKAIISGKLGFPNGEAQDSVFHLPTIWGAIKEYFFRVKGSYFMYVPKTAEVIKVEGAAMASYLIPRKVLNKIGLLDENIFIFFEDIEYARRCRKFGVPIYFDPQSNFMHHHGASTKKQGNQKSYEQLKKSSVYYHGKIYYTLLYYTLLCCQKFSGTKTPGEVR